MIIRRTNSNKVFSLSILVLLVMMCIFGTSGTPNAQAQGVETPVPPTSTANSDYFTIKTVTLADGTSVDAYIIKGPPEPPKGYEEERAAVILPEPNLVMGTNSLTVPAYDWFFGCSATSGAMIAAYFDRNGFANMYTGPTNGGVMPLDSSVWPDWTDGAGVSYEQCPLTASHQGLDGRTTRGSIDDYWISYLSPANDPYITGGWTQHAWGDAIGDYMKTSQSAYGNDDGSTVFYNYSTDPDPLTCSEMEINNVTEDGGYGRKLFYEAKGYTVTDCYNQKTDNNGGGYTYAKYKAEIDAGRPVMLNLAGHTVVGVGYDDATNKVYIHDTWDYLTHNFTWGTSYSGMQLLSVSIVNFISTGVPASFSKSTPANAATGQSIGPTLSWSTSGGATSYFYCYDTSNNNACNGTWTSAGANTSVTLSGLTANTTYYWQVRASNASGITYANGASTAFWSFTTVTTPGAFSKTSPANASTGIQVNPTLSWGASSQAASYEYCYDTSNNNACNGTWTSTGTNTSAALSGLTANTTYYWQVRAINSVGTTYANGASTAYWSFTTLNAPAAFSKTSPANAAVEVPRFPTLSWGASIGAASYEYCYDTSNNNACNGTWTSTGTNTSVTVGGLVLNTTYYWQVRATNTVGVTYANGASTAYWSFTVINVPAAFSKTSPPNAATNYSLTPTLSWGASTSVLRYDYCYDTSNDNACSGTWTSTGTNTSAALSGLTANTTYYWQVRAVNSVGATYANGGSTAFWSFTTGQLPGAFAKSAPVNAATGISVSPTLSWGASSGATSYLYCYDTTNDNACNRTWTSAGANTSVKLNGLSQNTTYYWQVRATNAAGTTYANGASTAFWSFTTGQLPGVFAKTAPANAATSVSLSPTLSWGASSGATSYLYCYDTTNDNACTNWTNIRANTSIKLSGLSQNTTYYWQVIAWNAVGTTYANGASTAFWSFKTGQLPGAFAKTAPANAATGVSISPTLSWGASSGATSYLYCYDTTNDNACTTTWISAGANISIKLSGLSQNTTYYWQVRATNAAGTTYANGASTAFWSFTTGQLPGAFSKTAPVNAATGVSLSPTLSWGASSGATSYLYCYDTTNDNACTNWTNIRANTSVQLTGLSLNTTYYWQVLSWSPVGTTYANGASTAFWSFKTVILPIAPDDSDTGH